MKKILCLAIGLLALMLAFTGCSQPAAVNAPDTDAAWGEPSPTPEETPVLTELPEETPAVSEPTATEAPGDGGLMGAWEGNSYVNRMLGFSAALPEGWSVASKDVLEMVGGFAQEAIESTVDVSTDTAVMLMMCSEAEYDIGLMENPNINITYSKQKYIGLLFSSPTYIEQFIEQMSSLYQDLYDGMFGEDTQVTVTGESGVIVNGKEYIVIHIVTKYSAGIMYQEQYMTSVTDGFLTTTLAYYDESMRDEMAGFIDGMVFE